MNEFAHCSAEAAKALGRDLTKVELDELTADIKRRARQKKIMNEGLAADEAFRQAAEESGGRVIDQAAAEVRNKMLNLRRRLELTDYLSREWADDPARGIEAILVGVNQARSGSRFSVSAEQRHLTNSYRQGFLADVKTAELWREFVSGAYDREIAEAMFRMGRKNADMSDLPKQAVALAEIIDRWQEFTRLEANEAGGFIGKLDARVAVQSHDMFKLRRASKIAKGASSADEVANREAWKEFVLSRIDHNRTFADTSDPEGLLNSTYEALASGVHLKNVDDVPFDGAGSIGKKVSHHRVLHFKDAKAWTEYNEQFGFGSVREAVLFGLEKSGHNTAMMRVMGPNAELNFRALLDHGGKLSADGGVAGRRKMGEGISSRRFETYWQHLTGEVNIPGHAMVARVSTAARAIQAMSKLGGAVLSSVTDVPLHAAELKYQGIGFTDRWGSALGAMFKGRGGADRQQLLSGLGVMTDGLSAAAGARFSAGDDIPGTMSAALQTYFKWNGLTWWTDTMRAEAAVSMSNNLAFHAGKRFDELDTDLKRAIELFGIDQHMWDATRKVSIVEAEGKKLFVPEAARDLDDGAIKSVLAKRGNADPTGRDIREMRSELERRWKAFFSDRADFAVINPDVRTRSIILGDARPGTVMGEFRRFVGQFKAFPVAIIDKAVGREVFGRGDRTGKLFTALANGNGEWQGLVSMITASTIFGYIGMSLKDLAKGREPRIPNSPDEAIRILTAAMTQGGGAGIYGDFLFGEWKTRYGNSPFTTLLGPTASAVGDIMDVVGRIREGDKVAAKAFRTALSNTPGANLFYTRLALDYAILYDIQEQLSPGYLRRMERRIKKENDQDFFLPPSRNRIQF